MMKERDLDSTPLIVGGIIPDEDHQELKNCGVKAIYTPKDYSLNNIMLDFTRIVKEAV